MIRRRSSLSWNYFRNRDTTSQGTVRGLYVGNIHASRRTHCAAKSRSLIIPDKAKRLWFFTATPPSLSGIVDTVRILLDVVLLPHAYRLPVRVPGFPVAIMNDCEELMNTGLPGRQHRRNLIRLHGGRIKNSNGRAVAQELYFLNAGDFSIENHDAHVNRIPGIIIRIRRLVGHDQFCVDRRTVGGNRVAEYLAVAHPSGKPERAGTIGI